MHAKLTESLPEKESADRTGKILRTLAQLQKTTADTLTPLLAAYGNFQANPNQSGNLNDSKFPDKSERQELRRSRDSRFNASNTGGNFSMAGQFVIFVINQEM